MAIYVIVQSTERLAQQIWKKGDSFLLTGGTLTSTGLLSATKLREQTRRMLIRDVRRPPHGL